MSEHDGRDVDQLVSSLDYPMWIVTVAAGDERDGCLVGFVTQCSIHPVRFLVCLSNKNRTYRLAKGANTLAVHLVADDQRELAELFGGETEDDPGVDKLADVAWHEGPDGVPILDDIRSWFVGRVLDRFDGGDHVAHWLEPVAARSDGRVDALMFHHARDIDAGHEA